MRTTTQLVACTLLLSVSACAQSTSNQDAVKAPAPMASGTSSGGFTVPQGFSVTTYTDGFERPRLMALAPNGDVFLSDTGAGKVYVMRGKTKAETKTVFASGLNQPHGLAFHGGYLYVANTDSVIRFAYKSGDQKAAGPAEKLVDLPSGSGHSTRTVVFGPDDKMYVAVGSSCNVCEESNDKRAAVWVYDADGKNGKPFSTGLRNAVGLEWYGGTLYATNNGRDELGDNYPPEGFYKLAVGRNFGWPYCYTTETGQPQVWDKDFGKKNADVCKAATPAFALTTAHSAPLGLAFYDGKVFPSKYQGQMFVALHGSWNRSEKSGYRVVTVDPKSGKVQDFMTGFISGKSSKGRPVDLLTLPDGSMLLTDDDGGKVYRITYQP
ncbi:sorbosone dehydrogenase family protein [Deinococcus psychrotolerans]|uniref:Sorbosone dehydrogenase family protein n=2 Tax=Deinococcus psychrotolerans TaxID=2489213 RepID=A0A3G8Y9H5_9DEIO|nr:sorbosone dehydrogenase family protein [Deinococcus psychrotolerans]